MKKILASLAGIATIGAFAVWAGWAVAQQPVKQASATSTTPVPPQRPGTALAVVNMNSVLKNYARAQHLNSQIRNKVQHFSTMMTAKRDEMTRLQSELTKPTTTGALKEKVEKDVLRLQREQQDIDALARKEIAGEQEKIAVQIFQEIEGVVQAVATANGFDMVLSYPDATTDKTDEKYSQENVVRKMAAQAAIPLFYKAHIDLTSAVVQTLNARYPAPAASPAAPAPAAPATPPRP